MDRQVFVYSEARFVVRASVVHVPRRMWMPNRLLTLVLCLLVLMPQHLCACHWIGCHGSSVSDHGNGDEDARPGDCAGSIDPAPAATHAPAGDAPGCSCGCHSHPGGHAD